MVLILDPVVQGLDLVCSALTSAGQTILVEEPTYFLAGQIFRDHGLRIVTVPSDGEGVKVDEVRTLVDGAGEDPWWRRKSEPRVVQVDPPEPEPDRSAKQLRAARRGSKGDDR